MRAESISKSPCHLKCTHLSSLERQTKVVSTRTGHKEVTAFLGPVEHRKLRHAAFDDADSMQDITAKAIQHWLRVRNEFRSRGIEGKDALEAAIAALRS